MPFYVGISLLFKAALICQALTMSDKTQCVDACTEPLSSHARPGIYSNEDFCFYLYITHQNIALRTVDKMPRPKIQGLTVYQHLQADLLKLYGPLKSVRERKREQMAANGAANKSAKKAEQAKKTPVAHILSEDKGSRLVSQCHKVHRAGGSPGISSCHGSCQARWHDVQPEANRVNMHPGQLLRRVISANLGP